jgi:hypothetical protein
MSASSSILKHIPKTSTGFESDYNSLKKDSSGFYQYLKNLPFEVVESLFKKTEIQAELFAGILKSLKEHGVKEDILHTFSFMLSIAKASNFDMTLMFMDNQEKKDIKEIIS